MVSRPAGELYDAIPVFVSIVSVVPCVAPDWIVPVTVDSEETVGLFSVLSVHDASVPVAVTITRGRRIVFS